MVQFAHLAVEGILLIIFPFVKNFVGSVFIFMTASMMATFAVGSTSALVPYVDKEVVGSVAGIVGMCSGLGGMFLITLSSYLDYTLASVICGSVVLLSGFLALLLELDGKDTGNNDNFDTQDQNKALINHSEEGEDV